jgi:CheY-like chemotaxis protein
LAQLLKSVSMKTPKLAYVIEDDPITSVVTELIIKKNLGCAKVEKYANGLKAFDQLKAALRDEEGIPDLILLDLNMPMMDGWEFLDAIADFSLGSRVCVFILTSSIQPNDMEKSKNYGEVRGYFSKPLNKSNIARMQQLFQEATAEKW